MNETVKNEAQRMALIKRLSACDLPFQFDLHVGDRSHDQNALSHVWYAVIGRKDAEYDTVTARRFCKLHFGVPIMRAGDAKFRYGWDRLIKPLPYETKLQIMDWWPVTSLMTHPQMREYLTAMQHHWMPRRVLLEGLDKGYDEDYPEARNA